MRNITGGAANLTAIADGTPAHVEAPANVVAVHNKVALKYPEAAALLSLSVSKVRELVESGTLPASRFGKSVLIRRADLDEMLLANPYEPAA